MGYPYRNATTELLLSSTIYPSTAIRNSSVVEKLVIGLTDIELVVVGTNVADGGMVVHDTQNVVDRSK